jgi:hypothetical protein
LDSEEKQEGLTDVSSMLNVYISGPSKIGHCTTGRSATELANREGDESLTEADVPFCKPTVELELD